MHPNLSLETHKVDICVVGGGMAGLIAAVAAARRGASVVLVHDRPVLGGNASSEVRMWICGAHGQHRKETGILEEMQLLNLDRNPDGLYSVWDSVLFEYAKMTPGLTTLLNCTCNNAQMEDKHIVSIDAWQLTTQVWHRVEAKLFIDCSGDSILAPLSGAETRIGREGREEFGESIAPNISDNRTMGNTVLLQIEETDTKQSFRAPNWAHYFDEKSTLPSRVGNGIGHNYWWLELGGLQDTISDAETIRDDLIKTAWGVWDYMKNRGPQVEKLRNWRLRWLGSLPGKRENRRYLGDYILTQNDIEAEGKFDDIVAYGGWSMDDHHPAGLLYPGKPTIFHKAPSPYGIPFRSLYSRNIPNLLCAGRNISATHCALSSTRVMATCALLGQAAGTAAALCQAESILPQNIRGSYLRTLQRQLMDDDCWLPGIQRQLPPLTLEASLSDSNGGNLSALLSGAEREVDRLCEHWQGAPGDWICLKWKQPRYVESLRLVFDSNLNDSKRMPCRYPLSTGKLKMPASLVKQFSIQIQTATMQWETIYQEKQNCRRLVVLPIGRDILSLRWVGEASWGDSYLKIFSIEASSEKMPASHNPPPGREWMSMVAELNPYDIREPDNGLESKTIARGNVGA